MQHLEDRAGSWSVDWCKLNTWGTWARRSKAELWPICDTPGPSAGSRAPSVSVRKCPVRSPSGTQVYPDGDHHQDSDHNTLSVTNETELVDFTLMYTPDEDWEQSHWGLERSPGRLTLCSSWSYHVLGNCQCLGPDTQHCPGSHERLETTAARACTHRARKSEREGAETGHGAPSDTCGGVEGPNTTEDPERGLSPTPVQCLAHSSSLRPLKFRSPGRR